MKKCLSFSLLNILTILSVELSVDAQCVVPAGAIPLDASFSGISTVASGQTYYVSAGSNVTVDHSAGNLTISGGGTILVLGDAFLNIQMGGKNMTVNGGTIQICNHGRLDINPGHDFTMQTGSLITLGLNASLHMCNFGHDITLNGGNIQMNDYSSFEMSNFHNLVSNAANLAVYTGSGSVSIGKGNPVIHTAGPDFINYSNTDNVGASISNSGHIDFVNDALGTVSSGSANYCGNKNAAGYSTCRAQWASMNFVCGASSVYLDSLLFVLPLQIVDFSSKASATGRYLVWQISNGNDIDHFDIERSLNNQPFQAIATLSANANNNRNENTFSYVDEEFSFLQCQYRIKAVAKTGFFLYSEILNAPGLHTITGKVPYCFPDPFKDHLLIITNFSTRTPAILELYNNKGMAILKTQVSLESGSRQTRIEALSSLPGGVYILKISTNSNCFSQRLVKE